MSTTSFLNGANMEVIGSKLMTSALLELSCYDVHSSFWCFDRTIKLQA